MLQIPSNPNASFLFLSAPKVRELSPAEAEKEAGNAAFKAGDWAEAVRRYGAALVLQPGLAAARNNRALALLRLGRNAEAEEDCTQVGGGEGARTGCGAMGGRVSQTCQSCKSADPPSLLPPAIFVARLHYRTLHGCKRPELVLPCT